ncbi:MAG TPA: TatD family hydrolase [Firmicutes bacterium]|nr:TatD family hydrolase [Bacillota bacterium]
MTDTHCHITDERYDAGEIIRAMESDGLEALVTVGYDTASSLKAAELAARHPRVYAAVGLHPSELDHEPDYDGVLPLLSQPGVVAYGEIGLDYHWDDGPDRETQKRRFAEQLEIAIGARLPVIVHSRDCDGDMLPLLKSFAPRLTAGLVMHCFSSSAELAREYVKLGFYISFAGPVTFRNARKGDVIRAVPDELLLAETDCPYLTPVPHRGEVNYPKYVRYTIEKLAEERGRTFGEIEELTSRNARRLFAKMNAEEKI